MFVMVIMALASTRPMMRLAERSLFLFAAIGGRHGRRLVGLHPHRRPAVRLPHHRARGDDDLGAPPGAAVLPLRPSPRLSYATIGLLFVNVSVGGTLTQFAAPAHGHGRGPVALGHGLHVHALRVEGVHRASSAPPSSTTPSSGRNSRRSTGRTSRRAGR